MRVSVHPTKEKLTLLLRRWGAGDQDALDCLIEPAYNELSRLARRELSARGNSSIGPGTLVHEAYLRLRQAAPAKCQNRAHFYALAARLMRFILIDNLRAQAASKRSAEPLTLVSPSDGSSPSEDGRLTILDVDSALDELAKVYEVKARIVELRYFGGLSIDETAEATGLSAATVKRHWDFARSWIKKWLSERQANAT